MKTFMIPADIRLKNLNKPGETIPDELGGLVTFRSHAYSRWLSDPRWFTPVTRLARLAKVQIMCEMSAGTDVKMEDADYEILLEIVKKPDTKLMAPNPLVEAQLLPFYKAVEEAKEVTN